jgi:hypothetical protein
MAKADLIEAHHVDARRASAASAPTKANVSDGFTRESDDQRDDSAV